jgi:LysM repeat protein
MIRIAISLALAAAALAAPAVLAAQDPAPRDTIVILPRGADADEARSDTLTVDTEEAPARRPSRRGQPFAVRSSGRVAPHAPARDVVWMHPDSIRRPSAEPADSVLADSIVITAPADDDAPEADGEILLDTTSVDDDRPARRRAASTDEEAPSTRRRGTATDEDAPPSTRRRSSSATDDDTPPSTRRRAAATDEEAPASTRRRAAAASEEDAPPSTRRRNAADEDAPPSTRRRNTDTDEEETPPTTRRRTAAADEDEDAEAEPAPRRSTTRVRADSAATRRATAAARAAARDSAARRTTAATRPAAGARVRTHTVASGESLFAIARRYGVTAAQLRALNPDVEGERLKVGTELRLPAAARTPAQSGQRATATGERATTPARPAAQRGRRSHTVESGETVYGLARRYGVTAAAIREANDLDEDARLRIGQTLVIPRAPQQ